MKCPNCSAECADQSQECDFCGHSFVGSTQDAAPPAPPAPIEAVAPPPQPQMAPPSSPYENTSQAATKPEVPNHLIWAIAATSIGTIVNFFACCCLPVTLGTGIAAIVYALKVNKFLETGEINSAEQAAKTAKLWCWITTILAILFAVWFIFSMVLQFANPDLMETFRKQLEAAR